MKRREFFGTSMMVAGFPAAFAQQGAAPKGVDAPTRTAKVTKLFKAPDIHPNALEAEPDGLWIGDQVSERLFKVDWKTGKVLREIQSECHNTSGIAVGEGSIWVAANGSVNGRRPPRPHDKNSGEVLQIDLGTGKSVKWFQLQWGNGVHGITYVPRTKTLWVTALSVNALAEVDPKDFRILRLIPVKHSRAHGLDYENGAVWCLFAADRVIHKLDARNGKVLEIIKFSPGDPDPHGLCLHDGHLYSCDAGLTATSAGGSPGYIFRVDV